MAVRRIFFFLKIADEREGTHLYEDYQKELAEAPVTEDEKKSTVNLRKRYLLSWNDSISRTSNGEKNDTILYLCPLNSLHAEMIHRRMEAEIADIGQEAADETHLYKDALVIQTYQHIEKLCRNAPDRLKESLSSPKYIVADECHYLTDFSTYNINTYLSLEVLQRAEKDHVVIYMSATGGQVYEMLNAATETPPDRIYTLPQNNAHIARMYFYARDNLEMILHDIPADEKAVIFMSGGDDLVKMKELFGDAAGYYCSENNARYGKKLDSLEDCIKDRMLQKRFLFTTKAIGMGIEIKDRTLKQSISPYRMPVLVDWIKEHLNQPMKWKDLYTGIMISKVFAEYRNRPMKPTTLNKKTRNLWCTSCARTR